LERSHIWASLRQAAAAILGSRNTVMSWQPRNPGAPKSFSSKVGWAMTRERSGLARGTSTMEILEWPGRLRGPSARR
jgi:hypothetical protein